MTTSAAPQATAAAARRGVIRRFAAPMSRIAKAGTMANVPPTLAPNPGQPDTATTASPTAATVSTAVLVLPASPGAREPGALEPGALEPGALEPWPRQPWARQPWARQPWARMPSQPAQNRPDAA